jgi:Skp family chaperone for outer membrane proteins
MLMTSIARILPNATFVFCALVFFGCQAQENNPGGTTEATTEAAKSGLSIVYVQVDSLQAGYTAVADELKRLEENFLKAQENHNKRQAAFAREVQKVQNQVQQGLLAPNQVQAEQQRLGRREQEIAQQQQMALNSIQEDQLKLQAAFAQRVEAILKELKEENNYDFVFNQGGGSGLLMSNEAYDITNLVLERLNTEPAPVMEKDSIQ